MSDVCEQPVFTEEKVSKELERIGIIDRVLAKYGALTIKGVYKIIYNVDEGKNFERLNDLKTFLDSHSNVYDVSFDLVRNRPPEFRLMFVNLINSLHHATDKKLNRNFVSHEIDRFDSAFLKQYINIEGTRKFFKRHKNFFIVHPDSTVSLNPLCFSVPSAWECKALSFNTKTLKYDKSIVITGVGRIISKLRNMQYIKIEIVHGAWKGEVICGLSKNVSGEFNLAAKFPLGSLVKVQAYRVYEGAHSWSASRILPLDDHHDIWRVTKTEKIDGSLAKFKSVCQDEKDESSSFPDSSFIHLRVVQINSEISQMNESVVKSVSGKFEIESAIENCKTKMVNGLDSVQMKFCNLVINDEIKKINDIDKCLRDGPKTFKQMFDKLINGDTFSYYSYMVNFVTIRTHLYEISGGWVKMRNTFYRTQLLKFLHYINTKSEKEITVNMLQRFIVVKMMILFLKFQISCHISNTLSTRKADDLVDEFFNCAKNMDTFLTFLEEHASIIELAEACGEQFIFLRGTYFDNFSLFLPKFRFRNYILMN
ncbi:unnamed protein product [Thelazia callipaeda]|uniref:RNA-dependent RNA polymerase n=1 Tax=Thelazia callipaeda TaxID=103827 RepID=A0A0N5D543_THECL|nr:unnamed protein product [Thelazia callipaeda]